MNKLIVFVLLAFSISAAAGPWNKTYTLVPVESHPQAKSCGAQDRLMKDVVVVHFGTSAASVDSANPLVNHIRWKVDGDLSKDNITLVYKANMDAYTSLSLFLVSDKRGVYANLILQGRTASREECWDSVDLVAK